MYNLYNPEADDIFSSFRNFLLAEKISNGSVRSYLSDVRFFFSWLKNLLTAHQISVASSPFLSLKKINEKLLSAYNDFLQKQQTPVKTINRRFSSLRKFGSFCISQKWLAENVFETLKNVSPIDQPFPESKYHLNEFKTKIWKKGASKSTIKNYLSDVKQFLAWTENKQKPKETKSEIRSTKHETNSNFLNPNV